MCVCVCVCVWQLAQLRSTGTRKAVISFGAGSGRQWIWGKFSKLMCHWLTSLISAPGILGPLDLRS